MSTCATCRHWIADDTQHIIEGFGACGRMARAIYAPDYDIAAEVAVVVDGAGAVSALKCKAEFGCLLHEVA